MAPRVALDARLVGYAAGIAQYALQLTEALLALGGHEQYAILRSRRAGDAFEKLEHDARVVRCLTPPHHPAEALVLPAEIMTRVPGVALLHSMDHVAPAWGQWKSVVTLHDLAFVLYPETHTGASRRYYARAAASARRAQRVIAVSTTTARDAARLFDLDPSRLRVIPEAAGSRYYPRPREQFERLAARLGVDPRVPYVLFVGTLEPRKNLPLLFEAFNQLRARHTVQLLVVGGRGWLDQSIFETHARLNLAGSAHFLGALGSDDVATLYSHARALALPSLYEGFGLVVLEAMACGAPVVCSNAGPLPEVCGDAAWLLPPDDALLWADALDRLISEPQLAQAFRERGFARAAEFSWKRAAEQTRAVYSEVLSSA